MKSTESDDNYTIFIYRKIRNSWVFKSLWVKSESLSKEEYVQTK